MSLRSRSIAREIGTALAVATIYMLVLLAPLHQAAGLQRDLADLGFKSLETWSVCNAIAQDDDQSGRVVNCAAAGIGKNEIAPLDPIVVELVVLRAASAVRYTAPAALATTVSWHRQSQPRAPPIAV